MLEEIILAGIIQVVAMMISVLVGYVLILKLINYSFGGDSAIYRKTMTNMYVIARIKKIAKEEGLDLVQEHKEFIKLMKDFKKRNPKSLDNQIELELINKVGKANKETKEKEQK